MFTIGIPLSITVGDITPPPVPSISLTLKGKNSYSLASSIVLDSSSPVEYEISRANVGSSSYSVVKSWSTTRTYTQIGMSPGDGYKWRVRSRDSKGNTSDYSFGISIYTTVDEPSLSLVGTTSNSATVDIGSVNGGNNYQLDYKQSSSGTWLNWIGTPGSGNKTVTGLSNFTLYDFRARASNFNSEWGDWSLLEDVLIT